MIEQNDIHNKSNNIETVQGDQVSNQQSNETEQTIVEENSTTIADGNVNSDPQDGSNKADDLASNAKEEFTEGEPSTQTVNSWNAVNAGVREQKAQIKGKDEKAYSFLG